MSNDTFQFFTCRHGEAVWQLIIILSCGRTTIESSQVEVLKNQNVGLGDRAYAEHIRRFSGSRLNIDDLSMFNYVPYKNKLVSRFLFRFQATRTIFWINNTSIYIHLDIENTFFEQKKKKRFSSCTRLTYFSMFHAHYERSINLFSTFITVSIAIYHWNLIIY